MSCAWKKPRHQGAWPAGRKLLVIRPVFERREISAYKSIRFFFSIAIAKSELRFHNSDLL